jgi:hypothetical protein
MDTFAATKTECEEPLQLIQFNRLPVNGQQLQLGLVSRDNFGQDLYAINSAAKIGKLNAGSSSFVESFNYHSQF